MLNKSKPRSAGGRIMHRLNILTLNFTFFSISNCPPSLIVLRCVVFISTQVKVCGCCFSLLVVDKSLLSPKFLSLTLYYPTEEPQSWFLHKEIWKNQKTQRQSKATSPRSPISNERVTNCSSDRTIWVALASLLINQSDIMFPPSCLPTLPRN